MLYCANYGDKSDVLTDENLEVKKKRKGGAG
jgi:hypothetical protein